MALRLNGSSSGYVELDVPAAAGSHTLTLPNSGGTSGQYLQTNGSGGLSWQTVTTPAVLQVESAAKTDTQASGTGQTWTAISNLSVSITPAATGNNILVMAQISAGLDRDAVLYLRLVRDGTAIGLGAAAGSRIPCTSFRYMAGMDNGIQTDTLIFLDSPATTSSVTYQVQVRLNDPGIFYINQREIDGDNTDYGRSISTLTVMEVAG